MAARSSWDGYLKLSLISVPVRAFSAQARGKGEVHFNRIHKGCGERIRYEKVCPVHGEVTNDEVVSGYPYEKNEYVEVDPNELKKVKAENDQSLNIDAFIPPDALDP